ncbi:MAG: S-methyl-5-thioribose-1-phosphate isomerase [Calditrichae bacterium]|nr:S-methyl-5-thioribose-1-phosphate isomerase [Calditrichia bacterium]
MTLHTISFENNTLKIIDQTLLPQKLKVIELDSFEKSMEAIKSLRVRGAPAIGIVAAYALYLEALRLKNLNKLTPLSYKEISALMRIVRPTAVNLSWAVDKMYHCFKENYSKDYLLENLKNCALSIHDDDRQTCEAIGKNGAILLENKKAVLTHCNAGILATGGNGTALSVIYEAFKQNKQLHVFVDETRPLGQGARLTFYELNQNNVNCTLLTDNAAASLFQLKKFDAVILGADRVTLSGDFANKIGTYNLAVLAKVHKIPFYVAAPVSSFDRNLVNGKDIEIEMRDSNEVLSFWNIDQKQSYKVYNPAFDVTPGRLVTAFITEKDIITKPFKKNINQLLNS